MEKIELRNFIKSVIGGEKVIGHVTVSTQIPFYIDIEMLLKEVYNNYSDYNKLKDEDEFLTMIELAVDTYIHSGNILNDCKLESIDIETLLSIPETLTKEEIELEKLKNKSI